MSASCGRAACVLRFAIATVVALSLTACAQKKETSSEVAALQATVAELKTKLAYVSDRQQIYDVELRYMRGFDRRDEELLSSAFWPDAKISYPGAHIQSVDAFAKIHWPAHAKVSTLQNDHLLTNFSVDISGDTAHVETYVTQFSTLKEGGSLTKRKDARSHIVSGRYIDRLDRRNGEWRIAVREFIPHFFAELDSGLGYDFKWKTYGDCGAGTQDRRDPSYLRPLMPRKEGELSPPCAE